MILSLAKSTEAVSGEGLCLNEIFREETWAAPPSSEEASPALVVATGSRAAEIKIAGTEEEWRQAFQLVAEAYRARGYETTQTHGLRLTPFHVLPDTATFIAQHDGRVLATLSLVLDNVLLGLPLECIYPDEIAALRRQGRRLVEVISLADHGLSLHEFLPVFLGLSRLMVQWALRQEADTLVITINPRHRLFYRKVLGFVPLGPRRPHPSVQGHPAEAYKLDEMTMAANAPTMHQLMFGIDLVGQVLAPSPLPPDLARRLARSSSATDEQTVENILQTVRALGSVRRW
jgi:hypothetical protein